MAGLLAQSKCRARAEKFFFNGYRRRKDGPAPLKHANDAGANEGDAERAGHGRRKVQNIGPAKE